jgi:hypothetical protein
MQSKDDTKDALESSARETFLVLEVERERERALAQGAVQFYDGEAARERFRKRNCESIRDAPHAT